MPIFSQHEHELLSELLSTGVEFVIIGGAAVVLYSADRPRLDLDLLISQDDANLHRLLDIELQWLTFKERHVNQLKQAGAKIQDTERGVDFVTDILGVSALDVLSTKALIEADGLLLPLIAKDLLIANKKAVGEPKDLEDLARLT